MWDLKKRSTNPEYSVLDASIYDTPAIKHPWATRPNTPLVMADRPAERYLVPAVAVHGKVVMTSRRIC